MTDRVTIHQITPPRDGMRPTGVSFAIDTNELTITWTEQRADDVGAPVGAVLFEKLNQVLDRVPHDHPARVLVIESLAELQLARTQRGVEHLSGPIGRVMADTKPELSPGQPARPAHVQDVDAEMGISNRPVPPADPNAPFDVDAALGRPPIPDFAEQGVHDVDAALGRRPQAVDPAEPVTVVQNSEVAQARAAAKSESTDTECRCAKPNPVKLEPGDTRKRVPCLTCGKWVKLSPMPPQPPPELPPSDGEQAS